ncbi:transcriptional regulator [Bacteroidia bacterium]|nr:transcriptional regulator [Bacteroidia bacterium]
MEKEGLNSALFADKISVSRGTITHVLNGRNKPSLEVIQKILETFPNINSDWLLVGKNPMYGHEKVFLHPQQESILFDDEIKVPNPPKNEINAYKEPNVSEYSPKSIDKEPVEVLQSVKLKEVTNVISGNRKIDKIIIFYDDKTFMSFSPEE